MRITVNGEEKIIAKDSLNIIEILKLSNVDNLEIVTVQFNGAFVDKNDYSRIQVKDGDEVDFVYFMGGGSLHFNTKILHSKFFKKDPHGSLRMPVYDNVAFEFEKAEDIELAFQGRKPAHMYSRITNPTLEYFEKQLREITEAIGVVALSSGMAAIANLTMAVCSSGDNIITSKHLFGNTYSLFERTLKEWGLKVHYADLTQPERLSNLIDKNTRMIFFETITNPQLEVVDIRALAKIAHENNIILVADTTLTPPGMFRAKDFGIDVEVLSSTKYISGGATSVGGLIIDYGTFEWEKISKLAKEAKAYGPYAFINKLRREVYRNLGSCLSPHNAYLQSLGLETLALRLQASCTNALNIAMFLENNKKVQTVNYPGLESSPYHFLALEQFGRKPGSLLTFDLCSKKECFSFLNNLKLIRRATNLQDNRTLILHPASTIFCEYDDQLKKEMGVRETMIRLSVGIEEASDLIADIESALGVM